MCEFLLVFSSQNHKGIFKIFIFLGNFHFLLDACFHA
jgi:hypothetical protein